METKKLKIALVHDYIKEYGGAERVLETLHKMYPDAPVYTAFYSPSFLGPHKDRFLSWDIRTTWLQNIPFKNKLLSYFRLIAPIVFSRIDLSDFDVVVVSATGTYTSPNLVYVGSRTKLICYCHTPPRYLYGFATAAMWDGIWWRRLLKIAGKVPMHFLRKIDFKAAQKPNIMVANSYTVAERIKRFYKRKAGVIYPPVEVNSSQFTVHSYQNESPINYKPTNQLTSSYYLAGGRLARPKHIDLIVKTCAENGIPLKVFGREFSGYGAELEQMATGEGQMVEFVGEVTDQEKIALMKGAKAYIFAAEDEDFGITPVEAMGVGTGVIAYKSGGVVESVINGQTGIFFNELSVESLAEAIKKFETLKIEKKDCIKQAEKFSKERFIKEMRKIIEEI